MGKTVLFSPIGNTDPMSDHNLYDGSMIHICRHWDVDKVVLYLSKEIVEDENETNALSYCLDRLSKQLNRPIECEKIERPDLEMVYDFNFFYKEFKEIVASILNDMSEGDKLLLNVSSGTPAMKSGLLVLKTLGEYPCTLVQVTTPERGGNHKRREKDIKTLWECNEDNNQGAPNRTEKISCPALSDLRYEAIIKKHIRDYDYRAALEVVQFLSNKDVPYVELLELARCRVLLDLRGVNELEKKTGFDFTPIKSGDSRKYFEYALNLSIKLEREEYGDFIRATSPLIVDLFKTVLKKKCKIDIGSYTKPHTKGHELWSEEKLRGTELENLLRAGVKYFNYGPIYSSALVVIIEAKASPEVVELAKRIREVEERVRNIAAHEIVSITDDFILNKAGHRASKIMEDLKTLVKMCGIGTKDSDWNSYKDMNDKIIAMMEPK